MHRYLSTWIAIGLLCAGLACGPPIVEPLNPTDSPTTSPTGGASQPSQPLFDSDVQPIFNNAAGTCNDTDCHDTTAPAVGLIIHVNPDAAQLQENYDRQACFPRINSYSPPAGQLLTKFCIDQVSNNVDHNGNIAADADCAAIYNWIATGTGDPGDYNCP